MSISFVIIKWKGFFILTVHKIYFQLQQGTRTSLNLGSDSSILAEQLSRERDRAEELNNRLNKSAKELNDANQREADMRVEVGKREKDLALVKHELKEMQRKAEQDHEARKKAESERGEMRKKLEDEMNKRTREQNNSHHVAERIANLEKEKREISDKLKKEMENMEKLKKVNTELSVSKTAAQSVVSDLNDKIGSLTEDRNLLEREMAKMQSQLQLEKNQRNEACLHVQDLEGKLKNSNIFNSNSILIVFPFLARLQNLGKEMNVLRDREQLKIRENSDLSSRLAEVEKVKANVEVELKAVSARYDQLVKSQTDNENALINNKKEANMEHVKGLESKLSDEKQARQRAEAMYQEKERELSMLTVDYRQLQYKMDKLEGEARQESEKARSVISQLDRLREEKSLMQSDLSVQDSEITLLKSNEKRLQRDLQDYRERMKSMEEDLHKVKAARSVDDLQRKELEDQLEAEQYFSTLYKTQVRELQDEVDEGKEKQTELESEKEKLMGQLQQLQARADSEALSRRVAEEDIAELEKEKMMIELELKDVNSKHKADARNMELQLASLKDSESDLFQKIDQLTKDNDELQSKLMQLESESNENNDTTDNSTREEVSKLQKLLDTERLLKQQAVNKLAEIMNRKDFIKKDKKAESKASSAELRKKEKDNRRLQQELTMEKEKFNQMAAKYQKDLQDLQATLYEESQAKLKMSMELDTKESELEGLQNKLAHINLDTASLSSGTGDPDQLEAQVENNLEGWLQVPSKQNIRRHGWKKLFVVVSSKKIIFFNSETERQNADPTLILDLK